MSRGRKPGEHLPIVRELREPLEHTARMLGDLRAKKGMSQLALSTMLEEVYHVYWTPYMIGHSEQLVDPGAVGNAASIPLRVLLALADFYGVSLDELAGREVK